MKHMEGFILISQYTLKIFPIASLQKIIKEGHHL